MFQVSNPVCLAAVPIEQYHPESNLLGAIFHKSITLEAREPNAGQVIYDLGNGTILNRMGLDNSGVDWFKANRLPYLLGLGCPIYPSLAGWSEHEFAKMAIKLCGTGIAGVELNFSCPNVSEQLGPYHQEKAIKLCKTALDKPVIVKISYDAAINGTSKWYQDAGADAITVINTVPGLVMDAGVPKKGGLSGKPIKHLAMRAVAETVSKVTIPVIACGGISSEQDVVDMLSLGASAVQIGTAELLTPGTAVNIIKNAK